jgi:hypothetical protein
VSYSSGDSASHQGGPGSILGQGHVAVCGGQSGAGADFLPVLRFFLIIWFVRLLALRPLLAYCTSLG